MTIFLKIALVAIGVGMAAWLAVIAHEWGHLALGHPVAGSLFGALSHAALGQPRLRAAGLRPVTSLVGVAVVALAPLFFLAHRRYAEYSADRAAALVVGDGAPVARALAKLAVGPALAATLDEGALVEQAERLGRSLFGALQLFEQDHPFTGSRCRAVRAWALSPAFHHLVPTPQGGLP